jgi:hypothetical protein
MPTDYLFCIPYKHSINKPNGINFGCNEKRDNRKADNAAFRCDVCGMQFMERRGLRIHKAKVKHGDPSYEMTSPPSSSSSSSSPPSSSSSSSSSPQSRNSRMSRSPQPPPAPPKESSQSSSSNPSLLSDSAYNHSSAVPSSFTMHPIKSRVQLRKRTTTVPKSRAIHKNIFSIRNMRFVKNKKQIPKVPSRASQSSSQSSENSRISARSERSHASQSSSQAAARSQASARSERSQASARSERAARSYPVVVSFSC